MSYLDQFQKNIVNNDLPSVVSLWQEYCLSDEVDPLEFKGILKHVLESGLKHSFGCYVEQSMMLWEKVQEGDDKLEILKLIIDLQTTNDEQLRKLVVDYLREKFNAEERLEEKLKFVGLIDGKKFQYAVRNFDILNHMKEGNFFIHTGGWGIGEVMEISMLRQQITLEFDFVAGYKELSFINAFKTMVPVSKEHFLARRFGFPEEFEAFARKEPVEVIRLLLKDLGDKTAQEIKDEMCELIIPEADWLKWWQAARVRLKKDPQIVSPKSIKGSFVLLKKELSHAERLVQSMATQPNIDKLIEMIYAFMRDFSSSLKNDEFKQKLITQLKEILVDEEISGGQELQILFILQDLGHDQVSDLDMIIGKIQNVEYVLDGVNILSNKKRLMQNMRRVRTDWVEVFLSSMLKTKQNSLRDYYLAELVKEGKSVDENIDLMISQPIKYSLAFLWFFDKLMLGKENTPCVNQKIMERCLESFFVLLHSLEQDLEQRNLVKKMHRFLLKNRFELVRKIFKNASLVVVKEVLLVASKSRTLSDHDQKILVSLAEVVYPQLSKEVEEEEVIIWSTSEGYLKVQERIKEIGTREIVENAKEIEEARALGDLRENSEFKAALEKKSRLQTELKQLSDQFKQMRVLTKDEINESEVGVGTVVSLENKKEKRQYTILGPFDADTEKSILSFQSKIAKGMSGKKVGDVVEVQNQSWKIVKIESFLETTKV